MEKEEATSFSAWETVLKTEERDDVKRGLGRVGEQQMKSGHEALAEKAMNSEGSTGGNRWWG